MSTSSAGGKCGLLQCVYLVRLGFLAARNDEFLWRTHVVCVHLQRVCMSFVVFFVGAASSLGEPSQERRVPLVGDVGEPMLSRNRATFFHFAHGYQQKLLAPSDNVQAVSVFARGRRPC